jgi:hypothetical protein
MKRVTWTVLGACFSSLAWSNFARAWDGPEMWFEAAAGGANSSLGPGPGGGGILGTGGASDHNITCANCHIQGANGYGTVDFKPSFNPPIGATYTLGQTYHVTMTMTNEHLGLSGCTGSPPNPNVNEFGAAFEDDSGKPVGSLVAVNGNSTSCQATIPTGYNGATFTYGDCHAIIGRAADGTTTAWTFSWIAPQTSTDVTVFYAGVDGNCMMDSLGDDAKVGSMKLGAGTAVREPAQDANRALASVGLFPIVAFVGALCRRGKRGPWGPLR